MDSTISLYHKVKPRDGASASGSIDPFFQHCIDHGLFGSQTYLSTTKANNMIRALLPYGNLDQMYARFDPAYLILQRPALHVYSDILPS